MQFDITFDEFTCHTNKRSKIIHCMKFYIEEYDVFKLL